MKFKIIIIEYKFIIIKWLINSLINFFNKLFIILIESQIKIIIINRC